MNGQQRLVFGGLVVSCVCGLAIGQSLTEDEKLLASDGVEGAQFGSAVAVDGTTAVIGAPRDTENGLLAGAAYVFDLSTGAELFKLLPGDGGNVAAHFGRSVAIDGGIIAVGAPGDSTNGTAAGSVYLFDAATGAQIMEITAGDAQVGDELGSSVALGAGYLAAGAAFDDAGALFSTGSVYVFNTMTGAQINKITAFDRASMDSFGESVAIGGSEMLAVGCRRDDNSTGAVYLYDLSSGTDYGKLTAPDGDISDQFGTDVAISGGVIAVSAPFGDGAEMNSGSVYLFDAVTQVMLDEIFLVDGVASDTFGSKLDIDDGMLAVGAGQRTIDGVVRAGAGYVYDLSTSDLLETLVASDGGTDDFLGRGVGIGGGSVLLGAPGDDDLGNAAGSAYVFALGGCPADLDGSGTLDFFDLSLFLAQQIDWDGSTSFDFFDLSAFLSEFGAGCS